MTLKDEIMAELNQTLWMSTDEIVEGIPEAAANIARMIEAKDEQIAALQERNAFLLTSAKTAQAKLAESRAEVERRDTYIAELAQKVDKLTAKGVA